MQIFIYRPDLRPNKNLDPNYIFTLEGQPFFEYQKDKEILRNHKIQKAQEKRTEPPEWKVYSY